MTTVLYVDDEPAICRAVQLWLRRHGMEVYTTGSVREAIALIGKVRPDGAFVDVWLADGSGFDLYDWVRAHDARLAERVVFVTGDTVGDPAVAERLATLGRRTLSKPFDLDAVKAIAAEWGVASATGR